MTLIGIAFGLQVAATLAWCSFYNKVNKDVWVFGILLLLLVAARLVVADFEVAGAAALAFPNKILSLLTTCILFLGVLRFGHFLSVTKKVQEEQKHAIEAINASFKDKESLALKLAEQLASLRDELEHYKREGLRKGVPEYQPQPQSGC